MEKIKALTSGKTKTLYTTSDPNLLICEFRDDTTAFNAEKKAKLSGKGKVNNAFNSFIMDKLAAAGIPTHFVKRLSDNEALVKNLDMLPVECVVRNVTAGSICKRLGVERGLELKPALFEFFYKDDALGDPLINRDHITTFGWASEAEVNQMITLTRRVNDILHPLFSENGLELVDFKLEFGRHDGQLVLGDEFTPDGCRIWDKVTKEILDKDRFRQDLGDVVESYELAAQRFGIVV